jgi:hypothetical protein
MAAVWRLCRWRHSRHYLPSLTMSCFRPIALYFRPILIARADIVWTPLHTRSGEGIYSEIHHRRSG